LDWLNSSASAMPPMLAATKPSSVVSSVAASDCDSTAQSLISVRKMTEGAGST
jgi:hypothetical protein